jgi:hypothetical protein
LANSAHWLSRFYGFGHLFQRSMKPALRNVGTRVDSDGFKFGRTAETDILFKEAYIIRIQRRDVHSIANKLTINMSLPRNLDFAFS